MNRRLNLKLLLGIFAGLLVLAGSVHLVHRYQVQRNAGTLLELAQQAQADGDLKAATAHYRDYVKLRPQDLEAQAEFALVAADWAEALEATPQDIGRANKVLETVVRKLPENDALRRRLAEFAMQYGRPHDAKEHLERLVRRIPDDAKLNALYCRALAVTGEYDRALQRLFTAIGFDEATSSFDPEKAVAKNNIDTYLMAAELVRTQLRRPELAQQIVDQMVAVNGKAYEAYLERARYRQRRGDLDQAEADMIKALELAPDDVEVILMAANLALDRGAYSTARVQLQRGVQKHPQDERFYRGLAMLEMAEDQNVAAALEQVEQGLALNPQSALLLPYRTELEIRNRDAGRVKESILAMETAEIDPHTIAFYQARLQILQRDWIAAAQALERLRPLLAGRAEQQLQVDLYLGTCYERLDQPDRALDAYRRALLADARQDIARQGIDRMQAATGQKRRMKQVALPPAVQRVLQTPAEARDWQKAEPWIEQTAAARDLDTAGKTVLRAELYAAGGDMAAAQQVIRQAIKQAPNNFRLYTALAQLVYRDPEGGGGDALQVLIDAEATVGDIVELRLAKAVLLAQSLGAQARRQLLALEAHSDKFSLSDQRRLLTGLGSVYLAVGLHDDVRRAWNKVADARPRDLPIRFQLFQLAREQDDSAEMQAIAAEIKQLVATEADPVWQYCQAALLIAETPNDAPQDDRLAKAQTFVDRALKTRPDWHELYQLQAILNVKQRRIDQAIADFQRSFELGPATPHAVGQLVQLLAMRGRYEEAQAAIDQLDTRLQATVQPELQAEIRLQTGNAEYAVRLARDAATRDPQNHVKQIWLGQVLARAGDLSGAEAAYRQAIQLEPSDPQARLALVYFFIQHARREAAQQEAKSALAALPRETRAQFSAETASLLGNAESATKSYRQALSASPRDPDVLQSAVRFYLSSLYSGSDGPQQALPLVERLLTLGTVDTPTRRWARRVKARLLAESGAYPDLRKALQLVEQNKVHGRLGKSDLLLEAELLAQRPEAVSRRRAVRLLEQLKDQGDLTPAAQLLLAQLHYRADDWTRCREEMLALLAQQPDDPTTLANWCNMLLDRNRLEQAELWIKKLATVSPDTEAARGFQARLLHKQGKTAAAADLITARLPETITNENRQVWTRAISLLEHIEQRAAAEKLYRKYAAFDPQARLPLAQFIGEHGDVDEAVTLLRKLEGEAPPTAILYVGLKIARARRGEIGRRLDDQLMAWAENTQTAIGDSPRTLLQIASLLDFQGRHAEEERIYRTLLADPQVTGTLRAGVLNNLAFNLAMRQQDIADAMQAVEEAIALQGPTGALLDTRAMVGLAAGDTDRAISDLNLAIADSPKGIRYFHLALAQLAKGDKQAAHSAFREATRRGFAAEELSQLEQGAYRRLVKALGIETSSTTTRHNGRVTVKR